MIVDRPYHLVPGRHHELLRAAWPDVSKAFDDLAGDVRDHSKTPGLRKVGLSGFPLQFELSLFADARNRLLDHAPELFALPERASVSLTEPVMPPRKWRWWREVGRLLRRCFKAGDVVLGSLASLFNAGDIVQQFKEGVEEGIAMARGKKS